MADVLFGVVAADRQAADDLDVERRPAADQRRRRQDAAVPVRLRPGLRPARPRPSAYSMVQAEAFNAQSGTQTETTSDTGGGQNVGFIAPGDWLAYDLDFGATSPASVTTRIASGATVERHDPVPAGQHHRADHRQRPGQPRPAAGRPGPARPRRCPARPPACTGSSSRSPAPAADLVNINWLQFQAGGGGNAYSVRQAESFNSQSGHPAGDHIGHRRRPERRLDRARRLARLRQCRLRIAVGRVGHHADRLRRDRQRHHPVPAGQHDRAGHRQRRRSAPTGGWQCLDQRHHDAVRLGHRRAPGVPHVHRHRRRDFVNINWFQFNR